jgi:AcrR family transcriptional regulator
MSTAALPASPPRLPSHLRGGAIGRGKVSAQVLKEHQRERVLAAAVETFGLHGYQAVGVDDLLSAAKVGYGNFYAFFDGKEGCLLAAFDWALSRVRGRVELAATRGNGWAEETYLGLGAVVSTLVDDPLTARFLLIEAQAAGEEVRVRHEALRREVVAWLARGRKAGPSDPVATFEITAIGGLAFYFQLCALKPGSRDPAELLEEAALFLLVPVVGQDGVAFMRSALDGVG